LSKQTTSSALARLVLSGSTMASHASPAATSASSSASSPSSSLTPLQQRLMACLKLNDDKVADVFLVGDDGIPVPALRCVLSCTSPVFDRMLYGEFAESSQKCKIPIPGMTQSILQQLVEYCCSDTLNTGVLQKAALAYKNGLISGDFCPPNHVTDSVLLAELGDKYQIPGLEVAVVKYLEEEVMKEDAELSCIIFDLCNPDMTPQVHAAAWKLISQHPQDALLHDQSPTTVMFGCGISCLGPEKLKELFEDVNQIEAPPLFMFQRLLDWYESKQECLPEGYSSQDIDNICRQAAGRIHLASIDPYGLKNIVMKAPFVDQNDILEAFMDQAILAHKFGLDFSQPYMHGDQPRCRHVLVEGAGVERINGVYRQDESPITALIQQQFTKQCPGNNGDGGNNIYLVQGKEDCLWFICDASQYYYHTKTPGVLPSTGWFVVSEGRAPAPTCKFFFYNDDDNNNNDGEDENGRKSDPPMSNVPYFLQN